MSIFKDFLEAMATVAVMENSINYYFTRISMDFLKLLMTILNSQPITNSTQFIIKDYFHKTFTN